MSLMKYWPNADHVSECIRTEAETIDEAILLAVHEPVRIVKRSASGASNGDVREQDLLDALLRDNADGSAVVVTLTGPSGVGKSHMVRWLHAQLARHRNRDNMVVILIPKTASLRQVVELILDPLKGAEYDALRRGLSVAIESIVAVDARARLATELGLQLKRKANEWIAALKAGEDSSIKSKVYHARSLEVLLGDHVFREEMLNRALERIVERAVSGAGDALGLPQFEVGDFIWHSERPISDASKPAQQYYQRLCDNNGDARIVAVDVINLVIDPAMRAVFRFSHALGSKTIEDIVDAIRVQLLNERKELVLLIEDFAALSGIQEPLLSLMIAESDHGGVRVRAPIRTALAVTDGFMPQRDTILTRAKGEWVIASVYADEVEMLDRLVDMAGRYLNAARWGRDAIRRQFRARADHSDAGLYDWVAPFQDEHLDATDADRLTAFGTSRAGFPLFPFNRYALHSLCRKELQVANALVFNPRAFINQVLRDTLDQRHAYEKSSFPPAEFKSGKALPSGAETDLDSQMRSPAEKARLKVLLIHWCGNPRNLRNDTPVAAALFEAFGLRSPFAEGAVAPAPQVHIPQLASQVETSHSVVQPPPRAATSAFEQAIEAWGPGKLAQNNAKRVRQLLGAAVGQRLDLKSTETAEVIKWIWLPYVDHSNPQTPPSFRLAEESGSVPGWIRSALIGLGRCDDNNGWNYSNAEDDYSFAQRLLDQFTPPVELHRFATSTRRLCTSMNMAYRQNLMFGIVGVRTMPTAFEKMFDALGGDHNDADFLAENDNDRAPVLGRTLARARSVRTQLQDVILQDAACFQGDGKIPMAIDCAKVGAAWAADPDYAKVSTSESPELMEHLNELGSGFAKLLGNYKVLMDLRGSYLDEMLGADFDKDAWIASIRHALGLAQLGGFLPSDFVLNQEFACLDRLAKSSLTELVRHVRAVNEAAVDTSAEERMRAYGRVDLPLLLRSVKDIQRLQTLLTGIGRNMVGKEQQALRDVVGAVRSDFIGELRDAANLLTGATV